MHSLIRERAATIECPGDEPTRLLVILRRTIPFHSSIRQKHPAKNSVLNELLQPANLWLESVLENHAQLYFGLLACSNQRGGLFGRPINGFLNQHMKTLLPHQYSPLCLHSPRPPHDHPLHPTLDQPTPPI